LPRFESVLVYTHTVCYIDVFVLIKNHSILANGLAALLLCDGLFGGPGLSHHMISGSPVDRPGKEVGGVRLTQGSTHHPTKIAIEDKSDQSIRPRWQANIVYQLQPRNTLQSPSQLEFHILVNIHFSMLAHGQNSARPELVAVLGRRPHGALERARTLPNLHNLAINLDCGIWQRRPEICHVERSADAEEAPKAWPAHQHNRHCRA